NGFSNDKLSDLKQRLLGDGIAFTCTAIVAGDLRGLLKNQMQNNERLGNIYHATYPVKWG
ncbi:hypothetical protein, partial [Paraburkholderia sp. RL17-373-BIF-A]|uniref:hypothetical protein n=1 Tax=Paraburkholderia sp. RL17-373-BIF-A TaxID=3031629 RepID=UPI0038BB2050